MITGIDHIAIAVSNLDEAIQRFQADFNLNFLGQEDVPSAKTSTAFFYGKPLTIELIHPLNQAGPVQKFIDQKGRGGLHHLCLTSDNLAEDIKILQSKGYVFIHETPQLGAHNKHVVWVHPKSCDGLLIEISQPEMSQPEMSQPAQDA